MTDLPRTIKETHKALLTKNFSATELVEAYLERIKEHDKALNSFITVSELSARKKAQRIDKLLATLRKKAIEKYPLLGIVVAYKDLFLTQGIKTTAASKVLANYVPVYSATVVKRLEKAGCITIGKTNHDAWAHGASGENSDFGPTKNPWNYQYVPGGSSSGSAVSVAAEFSLVSMGTDTGGSVRQPASFCSVVGLKPTYGAVSRYGIIAMASSMDSIGHFTRTVEDAQAIFNITRGEDSLDSTLKNSQYKIKNRRLKLGIPQEYFIKGIDNEVEKRVLEAARVFEKQGIELVKISLPHTKYAISVYYIIQPAEVSSNLARYDGIRYGTDREAFENETKRRIMLGTYVLSTGYYDKYYLQAMKVRTKIIEDFEKVFQKVDALLAPISPTPPFKLGEKVSDPLQMYLADIFTAPANLAGIPGLAMPAGFTSSGLPIGFQLMGPRFSEELLFSLGRLYQKVTDWHTKKPKLL